MKIRDKIYLLFSSKLPTETALLAISKNGTTVVCNAVFCGESGIRTRGTVTRTSV